MIRPLRWIPIAFLPALVTCSRARPPGAASGSTGTTAVAPDTAEARAIAAAVTLCRTTEAELRSRLGPPDRDGVLHGGRVVTWFVRRDSPERFLSVLLDSAGVVVDDYWDVPQEAPVVLENRCGAARETEAGPTRR
jgi:hypothetical protein